jgi:hypothetical protein
VVDWEKASDGMFGFAVLFGLVAIVYAVFGWVGHAFIWSGAGAVALRSAVRMRRRM